MTAVHAGPSPTFKRLVAGFLAIGALALGACDTAETGGAATDAGRPATGTPLWDGSSPTFDAGYPAPGTRTDGGLITTPAPQNNNVAASESDLPCGVATVLATTCWECHGRTLNFGAPMALLNTADFKANGKLTATATVGALTLTRMDNPANPMPPTYHQKQLSADEKKTLNDWVNGGMQPKTASEAACTLPDVPKPNPFGTAPVGGPDDCESYYEIRAHQGNTVDDKTPFNVASNPADTGNMYECFYFEAPYNVDEQGLWFAPIIDNANVLHHWLLYGADNESPAAPSGPPGTHGPCSAGEPGRWLIAGWAPGAPPTTMPPGVGLKLSKKVVLEVHYFNNTGAATTDRSGVKLCTAKKGTRPNLAGVHFTGTEGICVDPGQTKTFGTDCSPDYSKGDANGDIHIINIWPHMHKTATRMKLTVHRGGFGNEVIHDEAFDFNNQITYPKDIVLHRGDTMTTECTYTNTTNSKVHFGERTQDEMCYSFVTAWPAGSLQNSDGLDFVGGVAGVISPALRCLDKTSIFGSCNGLADYPK